MIIITGPDTFLVDPVYDDLNFPVVVTDVRSASGYISRKLDLREYPVRFAPRKGLYFATPRYDTNRYFYRCYFDLPDGYNVYVC